MCTWREVQFPARLMRRIHRAGCTVILQEDDWGCRSARGIDSGLDRLKQRGMSWNGCIASDECRLHIND